MQGAASRLSRPPKGARIVGDQGPDETTYNHWPAATKNKGSPPTREAKTYTRPPKSRSALPNPISCPRLSGEREQVPNPAKIWPMGHFFKLLPARMAAKRRGFMTGYRLSRREAKRCENSPIENGVEHWRGRLNSQNFNLSARACNIFACIENAAGAAKIRSRDLQVSRRK